MDEVIWFKAARYKIKITHGIEVAFMWRSGEWVRSTTKDQEIRHPKLKTDRANNYC